MRSPVVNLRLGACLAGALMSFGACAEDSTNGDGTGGRGGSGATAGRGGSGTAGSGGSSSTGTGGSSSTGGDGGSGGSGGSSAPTDGPSASVEAGSTEIRPIPALPPKRAGFTVFHSTNVSMWEIHDMAVYTQHKANFDEIIGILERGYFGIQKRLGTGHKLPIRVIIEPGGCCGGWAGGGDVGYADGDFKSPGAMNWVRGVVIGEVVNGVTGAVSSEWPRDWWADTAWYFPGFVTVDVLKEVLPEHATKWETEEKYPTYPVYVLYKALLGEQGWPLYQRLMELVKTDKMNWSRIGANPSAIKTNYVVAYLSLAAKQNLAERFRAAKVNADPAVVQAIMDARNRLAQAGPMAAGWTGFRAGSYQSQ